MADRASASSSDPTGSPWSQRRQSSGVGLGVVLVLLGGLFLLQQITGFDLWHWTWPFIVIAAGALLFAGMLLGGKSSGGLAIPASITTTTGLILLYQNTFNTWQTWAYTWTLIFPTAVGLGTWLMGWWTDQPQSRQDGRRMAEIGVVLFLGFAAFFELVLNLSGFVGRGFGGTAVSVIVILAGVYLLVRRGELTSGRA